MDSTANVILICDILN